MLTTATKTERPGFRDNPLVSAIGRIVLLEEECAALLDGLKVATTQLGEQAARIERLERRLREMGQPGQLMTEKEVAAVLRVHIQSLKRWREEKPTPRIPFVLFEGGDVRYRAEVVEAYLRSRERGVTLKKAA